MTESNVQPFEFRGNPVATVTTGNGTVLFCAKHVATALGYKRPADAVKQHCKGSVIRRPLETAGGIQQMVFITEGDVYRLIASSKLTSAVEFEHWLFDEVVPQIRRTGGYIPQGETPEETMARAVLIAQKTIEEQRKQLDEQKPKVLFADAVATSNKTGFKGHRQLFAADVDVLPGVGFAFYEVQWLSKDGSSSDGPLTTIVPFNNIESIEQVETVEAEDGGLK